jgi:L-rhamnose mutarotase
MERIAFCLRLRPGTAGAYDQAHQHVWSEMLDLYKRAGVSEYSIFRREELVFLVMQVENFEQTWDRIEQSDINTRWQKEMSNFFAPSEDLQPGERFPMMREIFYMK